MNSKIKKLIDTGIIICGRIIKENGTIQFERVNPLDIESIPEEERAYATQSMGRAIFTIDKSGKINNFKGVDSHLQLDELGPVELVNARAIEYIPHNNEQNYKISAVVFNDKKPEIRINGTSPLEDIEIEGDINKKLSLMGVKVPKIKYIREFPQEYSLKYGLPLKIPGSLEEFTSDYIKEDDERKKRLKEFYGEDYIQELKEGQRPESMREYLDRIGFLSSTEVQEKVKSLGYSMEDFINAVDKSYSRGQRYGQAKRVMDNPFRISDIEICIKNGDKEGLAAILDFSENSEGNFANILAKIFGGNIAVLMNNGWECENLFHRQDFSLSGEFCDDAYFDILEEQKLLTEKYKNEPYKTEALMQENKRRFTGQVMHIASCIKVVQDAMRMLGKNEEQINLVLNDYIDSFISNLDFKSIGNLLHLDETTVIESLLKEFSSEQNWTEKISGLDREGGIIMDEALYNSHINNEEFYNTTAKRILEKIKISQKDKQNLSIEISEKQPKPKFMYHISNRIPENETILKPHRNVDITQENEDDYVFASPNPDYISCFRDFHSIFRGGITDIDGTRVMLIVTSNIEETRKAMKDRPPKVYTLNSETFSQVIDKAGNPTNEWVSREEVPILDEREIPYKEILENSQVFYLQLQDYSMEQYNEFVNNIKQKFLNIKDALRYLVDSGQLVHENKMTKINNQWLENQEFGEK